MKEKNKKEKTKSRGELERLCADPRRAAYMIEWRERAIKNLREQLQGHEQLAALYEALLAFALFRIAAPDASTQSFVAEIPKEELRALLTQWKSEVSDTETAYRVTFVGKECEECDAPQA